jgi:hypothetical protein
MVVRAFFFIIIAGVIFWLMWWLLEYLALPQPFDKIGHVLLAIAAVGVLISIILDAAGYSIFKKDGP